LAWPSQCPIMRLAGQVRGELQHPARTDIQGRTVKGMLLERVPLVVTTWTVPVVAPVGTVVAIHDADFTVNDAGVPVKGDTGRARQIRAQYLDARSHFAGDRLCSHKRAQSHGQAENCAIVSGPAAIRRSVESPSVAWTSGANGRSRPNNCLASKSCRASLACRLG